MALRVSGDLLLAFRSTCWPLPRLQGEEGGACFRGVRTSLPCPVLVPRCLGLRRIGSSFGGVVPRVLRVLVLVRRRVVSHGRHQCFGRTGRGSPPIWSSGIVQGKPPARFRLGWCGVRGNRDGS